MIEFFQDLFRPELAFLRYALLIGIFAGPALGVVGTMVVTRRISSLAGASAHAALGGMGLALYLQRVWGLLWCTTTLGAIFGALGAALAVGIINLTAKEREDTAIGVVWALGMSIGLLFLDRTPGYVDWQGYLFGNILLLNPTDLYMTLALDVLVLLPVIFFYRSILAVSFDSVFAKLRKVPVNTIYLGLLVLTSLVIVLLINVVGIILVIALLTLPAAAAGCLTRHLWSMMTLACVFSWLFVISGLIISYCMHVPSGPAIVVIGSVVYLCCAGIAKRRKNL
jgi:zinc transport system permease protein